MLVPFNDVEKASEAVSTIFRAGYTQGALELMEIDALKIVSRYMDGSSIPVTGDVAAHLIIEVDVNDMDTLIMDMDAISGLLMQYECGEIYFADDNAEKMELWRLRRRVAEAVKMGWIHD